ncbi:MAG TPA: M20/M25/M40 family metallo-hydrolase [Usitatibacter sp.]|nr:M20/M25/M40 family metallo-hydrolase [Usitatibacter sp.]
MTRWLGVAAACAALAANALDSHQQLARDIYRELIEIRTVHPDGDNTAAARAMARRLLDAGFDAKDVEVFEPAPLKGGLVARLRGTGELKPLLQLAHIDVVDARREDWSEGLDPWKLTERDGFFYGRGTIDDKSMAAHFVANLIRLKREGFRGRRDIVVALTADEEGGTHNGVGWLLQNRRALIDAEFAINEGAGGLYVNGVPRQLRVQVSEKSYLSFELEAANPGGHSSEPRRDNAIYDLAGAIERLSRLELPVRMNFVLRQLAAKEAAFVEPHLAPALRAVAAGKAADADLRAMAEVPYYNNQMRTTCVATRIEAGHADNALPQRAKATVNCRLLPGEKGDFVLGELKKAAGERITVRFKNDPYDPPATDAQSPVIDTISRVGATIWPGAEVVPIMSAGATDGSRLRSSGIPVFGVNGVFVERGENRLHGRDERLGINEFFDGLEFHYRLAKALASGG